MNITIAGDLCPVGRLSSYNSNQRIDVIVAEDIVDLIKKSQYSVVNFECPVADNSDKPIIKDGPSLKCEAGCVSIIKDIGFRAASLANNHFRDYGDTSIKKTIDSLEKAGIDHVGGGLDLNEAAKILYIRVDTEVVAIINCCEHEFSIATKNSGGSNPIDIISLYQNIQEAKSLADYIVIITHGGHEHYQLPSPRMQDLYRHFINIGADAVVNHHQHCYSGYEVYKGKPIFYGLGNFMFDNTIIKNKKTWNEGYLVNLHLTKDRVGFKIYPYNQAQETVFVELKKEKDLCDFQEKILFLNSIINDRELLESHYFDFLKQKERDYSYYATPYFGKIASALYSRFLLPRYYSSKKTISLLNMINCESHLDILRWSLHNLIKLK